MSCCRLKKIMATAEEENRKTPLKAVKNIFNNEKMKKGKKCDG